MLHQLIPVKKWPIKKSKRLHKRSLRDLTAKMLSRVCKDTEIEQKLTLLTGELQTQWIKQDLTLEHVEFGKDDWKHF